MQKLKMHSPDMTQEHIARIRELFPNCVTEARGKDGSLRLSVDFDLLRQELSDSIVEGPQERYHLDWPGKRKAMLAANAPIAKALRPCREESVDFDTTKNLFIEGDNLDALKLLQETYLGKVKMIYIDPPYNTGNDFIYNDDFAETSEAYLSRSNQKDEAGNRLVANPDSNGRFHSDWLSMMYPRLKIARNLLADDGVIFISCDEHEVATLKLLCDFIFGSRSFVSIISLVNNLKGRNDKKVIATTHENILIYANSDFKSYGLPLTENKISDYDKIDENGEKYMLRDLRKRGGNDRKEDRPNLYFPLYYNKDNNSISLEKTAESDIAIFPKKSDGTDGRWRWGKERVRFFIKNIHIKRSPKTNYWGAEYRVYLNASLNKFSEYDDEENIERRMTPKSVWIGGEFSSDTAQKNLKYLMEGSIFSYPKSVHIIEKMLQLGTNQSDIILDFFAGSSTTAHAVMQLNAEDGGNRQFIMVQLPEACDAQSEAAKAGYSTIAEISKERIRRAGKKILEGDCHEGWNRDVGFRVLKVDTSNMADVFYTPDALQQNLLDLTTDNIKPGRTPEDLLFQVLLDWGVELTLPIRKESIQGKTVFFVDDNALVACFDRGIDEALVRELAACAPLRVVFRDNGFVSDAVKINVEQIFRQLSPGTEVRCL